MIPQFIVARLFISTAYDNELVKSAGTWRIRNHDSRIVDEQGRERERQKKNNKEKKKKGQWLHNILDKQVPNVQEKGWEKWR